MHIELASFIRDGFRGGTRGGTRGARALLFLQSFVFLHYFEELQTRLIKVKLNINNAPVTYVHPILSKHI